MRRGFFVVVACLLLSSRERRRDARRKQGRKDARRGISRGAGGYQSPVLVQIGAWELSHNGRTAVDGVGLVSLDGRTLSLEQLDGRAKVPLGGELYGPGLGHPRQLSAAARPPFARLLLFSPAGWFTLLLLLPPSFHLLPLLHSPLHSLSVVGRAPSAITLPAYPQQRCGRARRWPVACLGLISGQVSGLWSGAWLQLRREERGRLGIGEALVGR